MIPPPITAAVPATASPPAGDDVAFSASSGTVACGVGCQAISGTWPAWSDSRTYHPGLRQSRRMEGRLGRFLTHPPQVGGPVMPTRNCP